MFGSMGQIGQNGTNGTHGMLENPGANNGTYYVDESEQRGLSHIITHGVRVCELGQVIDHVSNINNNSSN